MKIELDSCTEAPWDRYAWHGQLVSIDGCDASDFTREDVDMVIAYGDTGADEWDGSAAGIALLKDGRFIAWESTWGPTGSGFSEDAYGGDADIAFASTLKAALGHISEQAREPMKWAITPDDIRHWFHANGTMHPIDTYDRAIAGDAEALRIVARDLDGGR